ncbi:MAG: recombinase family protein [Rhodanobacter sp.]
MARALAYVRVSKEKEDGISPELQLAAIERHCAEKGHTVLEVIHDLDLSGRLWKTRQIERVVDMIERREADVLVVWKISRVSRNMRDWVLAVDRVEGAGGHIESATENFDNTITGGFARGQMALFADFESKRIGESWKEAQGRRIKMGLPHTGTPRFGYTYSRDEGYTPDPEAAEALRGMYLDYLAGKGFSALASTSREHGGPQEAAGVKRMMDSGFAAGLVRHKGQMFPGAHEPIIDAATWERYQKARKRRSSRPRAEVPRHVYSGLVRCWCGSWMGGNRYTQNGVVKTKYGCAAYRYGATHTNSITEPVVDAAVMEFLEGLAEEWNARADARLRERPKAKRVDPRPKIKAEIAKLASRTDDLIEKWLDGKVPEENYERMLAKYKGERAELEERLEHLDAQVEGPPPAKIAADLLGDWDRMPPEVKREILSRLIARIEVPAEPGTRWRPKTVQIVPYGE